MPTFIMNTAKMRCKIKAWMREPEWEWHIVHTDNHYETTPRTRPDCVKYKAGDRLGTHPHNKPNGPNDITEVQFNETI